MENDSKRTSTPKLRFPEFREAGGWMSRTLAELATSIKDRVGTSNCVPYTVTSGVGLVSQQKKFGRSIAGNSFRNYVVLRKNAFAYNKSATKAFPEGFIARYVGDDLAAVPNSIFTCFVVNEDAVVPAYLDYLFHNNLHGEWLRNFITVGARAHGSLNVNDDDLMALPVPLPGESTSLEEQQKIADCLTSLDEVISAQGRKVETLRAHKRGLMHQLFPSEGETQPRFRFPEFHNAGEWEKKHFSELCDIKHGYAFEGEFFTNQGEYVLLTPGNFYEEGGYRDRGEKQKYYNGEIPPDYVLDYGDLLVAMTEQAAGLLGSPILVTESDKFLHNQRLGLVTKKLGVAWTNEFFFHVFNTQTVRKAIHASASGAKVRHTSPAKIGEVVVAFPTSLPEQQRIAACISSIDDLIAAQTQKLVALRTHKKALMQQLFPSPEVGEA